MKRLLGISLLLFSISVVADSNRLGFETSECPLVIRTLAHDHSADISCGYLSVPEDREASDSGSTIEVFVVKVAAREARGNAPLVFLNGGPGAPVAARIPSILASRLHQHYDVIAIDQRGAGFSRPSLNCWEGDGRAASEGNTWLRNCYRRLDGRGIGLHAYNSANNANDIHDLLVALNIEEANIYGFSYGSQLALTLARDFPKRVRTLILDGVLPLHVNRLEAHAPNGYRAMAVLFADCAADADCNSAYPNLSRSFYSAITTLNQRPTAVEQAKLDYPIMLTGDDFVADIYTKLYDKQLIRFLPALIHAYAIGDYDFDVLAASERGDSQAQIDAVWLWEMDQLSEGLAYSVACAEEIPFNSRDRIVNQAASMPASVRRPLVDMAIAGFRICDVWDVPRAPDIENQPVASDIPALLLSGRYDPVTPAAWGEEAAKYLANSWHYVFPNAGHGVLFESDAGCADSIALAFLAHPQRQPTDACLGRLPRPGFHTRP